MFCGGIAILKKIDNKKRLKWLISTRSSVYVFICNYFNCPYTKLANIGQIPDFEKKISVFRSREISATIILQAMSQLKAIYKESADTIIANCDSFLFFGSMELSTFEWVSKMLNK
ncbi:MAG: TraM recognition domain-containing protein [Oscillospiraceae bacterium]|jgi:type IV secretion system protein VirD4|nr:TraM recognition domain-containing protein [Oscillospiraceae bacterium]